MRISRIPRNRCFRLERGLRNSFLPEEANSRVLGREMVSAREGRLLRGKEARVLFSFSSDFFSFSSRSSPSNLRLSPQVTSLNLSRDSGPRSVSLAETSGFSASSRCRLGTRTKPRYLKFNIRDTAHGNIRNTLPMFLISNDRCVWSFYVCNTFIYRVAIGRFNLFF